MLVKIGMLMVYRYFKCKQNNTQTINAYFVVLVEIYTVHEESANYYSYYYNLEHHLTPKT